MKKTMRIIAITLLLAVWGSVPVLADGPNPVPLCWPTACPSMSAGTATPLSFSGPGDPPLCYPGEPACPIK